MMEVSKKIDTSHAEVKTATVSVKVLTINARKMTLSVFRQVQEDQLFVVDGERITLSGVPWGTINYHWGDQYTSDLHVLWVKNGELRRSLISHQGTHFLKESLYMRDYEFEKKIRLKQYWDFYHKNEHNLYRIKEGHEPNVFGDYDDVSHHGSGIYSHEPTEFEWNIVNTQIARFRRQAVQASKDLDEKLEQFSRLIDSYNQHYKQLTELDQLFIAV